jgi:hypothetical protein
VVDVEKRKWEDERDSASFYSRLKLVCKCHDSVDESLSGASGTIFMGRCERIEWEKN